MSIILTPTTSAGLVSTERASYNSTLAALAISNLAALQELILAASQKIIRYCHRQFALTSYTEYYDGGGLPYQRLALHQYPVTEITRMATNPQVVMRVTNAGVTTNQRATVETIGSVVRLKRVASAVATTVDLGNATYITLAGMATAINSTPGSWSAVVQSGFELYPSVDLNPLQGAADALRNSANLEMHIEDLNVMGGACFGNSAAYGGGAYLADAGWRLDSETGELWGAFPEGERNIRVDYSAGFSIIPSPVQEACVLLTQDLVQSEAANRAIVSGSLGPYKFQYAADQLAMSKAVRDLLSEYVSHDKTIQY